MEHLKAAVVSIRSIKLCDRNILEHNELTRIEDLIRFDLMGSLEKLTKEASDDRGRIRG